VATTGMVGGVWMLHMAIAAIWAGELDLAEQHVVSAESVPMLPDWTAWAGPWLRGLIAEARGDVPAAHALLAAAAAVPVEELPLYRAHLMADLARVARAAGDAVGADLATSSAQDRYRQLGAVPYLETSAPSAGPVPTVPELEALTMLSDRERDVVTLLVAGLSYAQIARDLYVTRSTVGFHLSNIYAKTGTTSRHGLTDLVRGRA